MVETTPAVLRLRLYPTPKQAKALEDQAHATRYLWNEIHARWSNLPEKTYPSYFDLCKWVRGERLSTPWLKADLPAQSGNMVARAYRTAWERCWDKDLPGMRAPRFKARDRNKWSVDYPQGRDFKPQKLSRRYASVQLAKVGRVKVRTPDGLPDPAAIRGATATKEADGWYLCLRYSKPVETLPRPTKDLVALDRGIVLPVVASDRAAYVHTPYVKDSERRSLHRTEQAVARKTKAQTVNPETGEVRRSRRLEAEYDRLKALHGCAARRRKDFNHQVSAHLAAEYHTVAVERLNVATMTKKPKPKEDPANPGTYLPNGRARKAGLNRSILNEAWSQLHEFLAYKTKARGGEVVQVPAAYSSQECHKCGSVAAEQRESQASFVCHNPACGWHGNADYNAAKVLEKRGQAGRENPGPEGSWQGVATSGVVCHVWVPNPKLCILRV